MFRPVRKSKNALGEEVTKEILRSARRGVLAVNGDGGYPYAIPINYLYDEEAGKIYFHGAKAGHKADSINKCDKVCFTAYGDEIIAASGKAVRMYEIDIEHMSGKKIQER